MRPGSTENHASDANVVFAEREVPIFSVGDMVRVAERSPVGHYRVPTYLRGKTGVIEAVIEPPGIDNEDESYGRNAGIKLHYYRVSFPMTGIWENYKDSPRDALHIEVFETWLQREKP
jgi:hypothetical protein